MKIKNIALHNFRNYKELKLEFKKKIIYIVGLNGQGKTNIVEAISVLALLSSFRTKNYELLLKRDENAFFLRADFIDSNYRELNIKIGYEGKKKKVIFQDKKVMRYSDLWGKIPLVYLIPDESIITSGPPGERRKFLDRLLSLVSRTYFDNLKNYNRVLKQKNALLVKAKKENMKPVEMIEVLNSQLVNYAVQLVSLRVDFLQKYEEYFCKILSGISDNAYKGSLKYNSSVVFDEKYKEKLSQRLKEIINIEIIRGTSLSGPHKDDLNFEINNYNLRNFGSKGQHKIFLVALKLAEIEFIKSITNEYPIFILDDLYSEIDNEKCEKIAMILDQNIQTFITTCDYSKMEFFNEDNIQIIEVENGICSTLENFKIAEKSGDYPFKKKYGSKV